ncbi:hypothetical protein KFF05_02035 [bacterium SCSIO 12827]|nr:hypothetical protein KFF05_02035 [bacterium SCSIO 12827]
MAPSAGAGESYPPFADEKPLADAVKAAPTPENLRRLGDARLRHAVILRGLAGDDTRGPTFQRFLLYAESAAKLAPRNPEAWKVYGAGLLMVPDWPLTQTLAEEAFRQALAVGGGDAASGIGLGQALFNQRRFDAARAQWERTLRRYPLAAEADVLGPLNLVYILSGEVEAGVAFYDELVGPEAWPAVGLAQGILIKHLLDRTGDGFWQARLDRLDDYFMNTVLSGEEAQTWVDLRAKWRKAAK